MYSEKLRLAVLGDIGHVNIQRWCESLVGAGVDLAVISFAKAPAGDWTAYQLPMFHGARKLNYLLAASHVKRLLTQVAPDVVAAYYITGYGTLGALSGFHPLVQVTSGSDVLTTNHHLWMRYVARRNLANADLVTAWAPHMAEAAVQLGADRSRLFVLPRGIAAQAFAGVSCRDPHLADNCVRLISTRSLKAGYRVDRVVDTARILKENGLAFKLTIVGDGPQRSQIEHQIRVANLQNEVNMMGFVSNSALPAILAEHDIYISLVPSDGVSASLLEAMCVGLLPLVTRHPANEYWVTHQQNGILLDTDGPASIADKIFEAAKDIDLRSRARIVNQKKVLESADMERNAAAYLARFAQLCEIRSA